MKHPMQHPTQGWQHPMQAPCSPPRLRLHTPHTAVHAYICFQSSLHHQQGRPSVRWVLNMDRGMRSPVPRGGAEGGGLCACLEGPQCTQAFADDSRVHQHLLLPIIFLLEHSDVHLHGGLPQARVCGFLDVDHLTPEYEVCVRGCRLLVRDQDRGGEGEGGLGQAGFVHEGNGGSPVAMAVEHGGNDPSIQDARERAVLARYSDRGLQAI
mmetsp:Transcript_7532/g.16351  ORF Transcript_7532/g.16351 Transcript_7532/m.16351 type:complete len:210 (-) Transcript_7532:421-1050(-)